MRCLLQKYNNRITPPRCVDLQCVIDVHCESLSLRVSMSPSRNALAFISYLSTLLFRLSSLAFSRKLLT